jgi:hypothetical protein
MSALIVSGPYILQLVIQFHENLFQQGQAAICQTFQHSTKFHGYTCSVGIPVSSYVKYGIKGEQLRLSRHSAGE